ncbi:hypothetical protein CEQ21_04720 [Niallia circulans]|uniref:Uncharacterized protein n=1 Tax=Niallia circulans TaxID=1397 RepID=A0A553STB1_NIACI|nr:hypothetical protein CEQ21_04720 [Niallia circulans]
MILISILFFSLVFILVVNLDQANIDTKAATNFKDKNLYQISDRLFDDRETEFFSNKDGFDILSNFNNKLSSSSIFVTYTANFQPISVADFKGDNTFNPNYQSDLSEPNTFELDNKVYFDVLSLQVNDSVFELNNLQLLKGRVFSQKEYFYNNNEKVVPIILGSDYVDIYKLDEIIDILIYNKKYKAKVIGFFSTSQKVMTSNDPEIILDKYMILPAILFNEPISNYLPQELEEQVFFRANLFAVANSLLLTKDSPLELRKKVDTISEQTGFKDYEIIGANGLGINTIVKMTKANMNMIYIAIAVIFCLAILTYIYILHLKIKKNVDTYIVLLISGANMKYIKGNLSIEFLLINIIGIFVPLILFLFISMNSWIFIVNFLFVSVVFLLIIIFVIKIMIDRVFKKVNIVQHLKG